MKNKTLAQLKTGALAPLFKSFLEAALEAELSEHLQENQEEEINRRNGHGSKQLRTSEGTVELVTPRDRSGSFEPEIVKNRQTILADNLEGKIIGMYGLGMKPVYLASERIAEKWTTPLQNWSLTIQQLSIIFEGRVQTNF